jgi:hypothetical protein
VRFILELWPSIENATPKEYLRYALESINENPELVWDIEDDNGNVIATDVTLNDNEAAPVGDPLDLPDRIERGAFDDLLVNLETACRNRRSQMKQEGLDIPWEE